MNKEAAKVMLYHDLPEEEAERLAEALPKQPWTCFSTGAQWDPFDDPNFADRIAWVYTGADRILPYDLQQEFSKTARAQRSMVMEGSSHSPHSERPRELAAIVIALVKDIAYA